jgi:diguanylate cyclase (GGDEF)-like protein
MLFAVIILFALNILFFILLKKALRINLYNNQIRQYEEIEKELESLLEKENNVNRVCEELRDKLERNIGIYEMTKQIYKFLDEDLLFSNFKEVLANFLDFKECQFIKKESPIIKNYDKVIRLKANSEELGFLAIKAKFSMEEEEIFYSILEQFNLALKRAKLYQKMEVLSISDFLTGLYNRRYFLERLKEELNRAIKFNLNFSLIMMDVDNFKIYNDNFGHLVGDYILKEIAKVIKSKTRHIDLACRYGGDEFCILLPQTDREGGYFASERIRKSLETKRMKVYDEEFFVTVSMGITSFPEDAENEVEIIEKADIALYNAKRLGKNKTVIYKKD